MILVSKPPEVDPVTVQWWSDGRVIYTVETNLELATAKSARLARQIVADHNAALKLT